MLVDEVDIIIKGGDGGRGSATFRRGNKTGPDGGNGGKGGDIYVTASSDLTLLAQFNPGEIVSAENGIDGGKNNMTGRNGVDLKLILPIGTLIQDTYTGQFFELEKLDQEIFLCHGGTEGIGNVEQKSPTNTTPKNAIPPKPGQTRPVKLILRFIADFGLIGLPSSGKSSLLNELTNSSVKTAAYHFTTLSPNLGVLTNKRIIADIPGLIEGAHDGKGLGIKFLKHIQKVTLLLHCIGCDSTDPIHDYKIVRGELGEFDKNLLEKKEIILLTKTDLLSENDVKKIIKDLSKVNKEIVPTSIYDPGSIMKLKDLL